MFSLPLLPCVTPPLMDSVSGGAMMASVLALSQMHLKDRSNIRSVAVPVSLLFSKELTPAAKFVWIRLRFDEIHRGGYPRLPRAAEKANWPFPLHSLRRSTARCGIGMVCQFAGS